MNQHVRSRKALHDLLFDCIPKTMGVDQGHLRREFQVKVHEEVGPKPARAQAMNAFHQFIGAESQLQNLLLNLGASLDVHDVAVGEARRF
jgi:hypothetical protein